MEGEQTGEVQITPWEVKKPEVKTPRNLSEEEKQSRQKAWNEALMKGDDLVVESRRERRDVLQETQEKAVYPLLRARGEYIEAGGGEKSGPAEVADYVGKAKERSDERNEESCEEIDRQWNSLKQDLSHWFEVLQRDGVLQREVEEAFNRIRQISKSGDGQLEGEFSDFQRLTKGIFEEISNANDFLERCTLLFEGSDELRSALSALLRQSRQTRDYGLDISKQISKIANGQSRVLSSLLADLQRIASDVVGARLSAAK